MMGAGFPAVPVGFRWVAGGGVGAPGVPKAEVGGGVSQEGLHVLEVRAVGHPPGVLPAQPAGVGEVRDVGSMWDMGHPWRPWATMRAWFGNET